MSSARIAKLEVLLTRIGARRGLPRLAVVAAPEPALAPAPAPEPLSAIDPLVHELTPAIAFASEPEPASEPTLSIQLDDEDDDVLPQPSVADLSPESAYGAQLAPAAEAEHTLSLPPEPAAAPRPEPIAAFQATNEPHYPAPQAPVTFSMAPSPATPSMAPPRMSLPSRPSIPSPDIVPDSLPFTLMTERPPAPPGGQESLELAAIALSASHSPMIDVSNTAPVVVALQSPSIDVINIAADALTPFGATPSFAAGSAVTVMPGQADASAADADEPSLRSARAVPPPAVVDGDSAELEPDAHAPQHIHAGALAEDAVVVTATSALQARLPLSFGALLGRSLALRPRSES